MSLQDQEVNAIHKTFNVTEWMKEQIQNFITEKGYTIALFTIDSEIMVRMGKISILNNISLKIVDSDGKNFSLDGYSSTSKEYDSLELKWLVDFIKEKEKEAILRFGGKALGTENSKEIKKDVEFELVGKKTEENSKFSVFFASNVKELMSFFLERNFQSAWIGPSGKIEDNETKIDNVTLKGIKATNSHSIELEYKWNDWKDFSNVCLDFIQVGDSVKVTVSQTKIPVGLADNVINHWKSKIFFNISILFRCPIRPSS